MYQWVTGTERENKFSTKTSAPICFNGGTGETTDIGRYLRLKFGRENILQVDFQSVQNSFQFVQSQMVFAMVEAKQSLMRYADLFGKLGVREIAAFLSQKRGQLFVQIALHCSKVAKTT
jgi:hypothetical protein